MLLRQDKSAAGARTTGLPVRRTCAQDQDEIWHVVVAFRTIPFIGIFLTGDAFLLPCPARPYPGIAPFSQSPSQFVRYQSVHRICLTSISNPPPLTEVETYLLQHYCDIAGQKLFLTLLVGLAA